MKERPILFNGPMVRAILAGTKTQTRRVVKDPMMPTVFPPREAVRVPSWYFENCPHGIPGDRLWVRETFATLLAVSPSSDEPLEIGPGERLIEPPTQWVDKQGNTRWHYNGKVIAYRANSDIEFCDGDGFRGDMANRNDMPRWKPSIHMPRWASRITLEITGVRVERLQDITDYGVIAEGFSGPSPRDAFAALWDSTTSTETWDSNPWVWVITFRKLP